MAAAMGGCLQNLGQLASLHLPRALLAVEHDTHLASTASPTPHPVPRPPSSTGFRPSVAVIVGVLTTLFSITFLLLLYAKHCRRTMGAGRPYGGGGHRGASFFGAGATSSGRRNSGVDRGVVESLPVFRFGSLRGPKDGLECAVCLGRFEAEELLRLLPKCRHAFHVECVDTWLDAHSTCPLCRHRVDPEDVLLAFHAEPPAAPKPHPAAPDASPLAAFELLRACRVSGRHSSAGEKRSDAPLQVVIHRVDADDPTQRNSADSVLMLRGAAAAAKASVVGCFDGRGGGGIRKDRLLLTESPAAAGPAAQRRFGHRIVVSGDGEQESGAAALPRRWSDIRPQDMLVLRREMILADGSGGGRASSCSSSGGGGAAIESLRSVSEITGLSRLAGRRGTAVAAGRRAEEERVLRRWLALASKRAGRWLGRREEAGGPGC